MKRGFIKWSWTGALQSLPQGADLSYLWQIRMGGWLRARHGVQALRLPCSSQQHLSVSPCWLQEGEEGSQRQTDQGSFFSAQWWWGNAYMQACVCLLYLWERGSHWHVGCPSTTSCVCMFVHKHGTFEYVCVSSCVNVCTQVYCYMYASWHIHICSCMCTHVCTYINVSISICSCMHVYMWVCTFVFTYANVYACIHVKVQVCVYICKHVCLYTCVHMFIHLCMSMFGAVF